MAKNKMNYGKKNQLPDKIDPRNVRVSISMRIEGDLLDALKAAAKRTNVTYQTLFKELARAGLGLNARINIPGHQILGRSKGEQLEEIVEDLRRAVRSLEKKVG